MINNYNKGKLSGKFSLFSDNQLWTARNSCKSSYGFFIAEVPGHDAVFVLVGGGYAGTGKRLRRLCRHSWLRDHMKKLRQRSVHWFLTIWYAAAKVFNLSDTGIFLLSIKDISDATVFFEWLVLRLFITITLYTYLFIVSRLPWFAMKGLSGQCSVSQCLGCWMIYINAVCLFR